MKIIDLTPDNEQAIEETAALLVESFKVHYPEAWPNLDTALEEVRASFAEDRISRIAIDEQGHVLGWIGGISMYDGNVWELHPLGVKPEYQGQGVGRALVIDFEEQVRQRGGLTIYLGSDDEDNQTSLSGVNLYEPNVLEHLANIKNPGRHPYEFYQKLGFVIVGVLPDANGPGRPDIFMAKRVRQHKA
jgi:aminoglycoside 6'-N-acetyltransferase I